MRCLPLGVIAVITMAWWAAAGCGMSSPESGGKGTPDPGKADSSDATKPGAAPLQKVKLALNWYPEMEHGGYYAALLHGYYKDEGLDVEIIPGGPNAPVGPQVDGGQVTFGLENADRILMLRAGEAKIVGLMAPLQQSPRCLIVHDDSGIQSFDDLHDVTIAMSSGAPWAVFLRKTLKLDEKNVRIVPNPGSLAVFLDDKKFVQQGYIFSEPIVVAEKGGKARSLMVSELGFNPYTSVLICNEERVAKEPELVRKMVAAAVKGWKKYLESPEEVHRKLGELNQEMTPRVLSEGFEAMKPLCQSESADGAVFGRMTRERWETLGGQLVETGIAEKDTIDTEKAYTVEFLPSEPK